jgi:hypothetical protein
MAGEPASGHDWGQFITSSDLHADYTTERGFSAGRSMETEFERKLRRLVPNLKRTRRMVSAKREYGYVLPSLKKCRSAFDQHIGHTIDWCEKDGNVSPVPP